MRLSSPERSECPVDEVEYDTLPVSVPVAGGAEACNASAVPSPEDDGYDPEPLPNPGLDEDDESQPIKVQTSGTTVGVSQGLLWKNSTIWKGSVAAKLKAVGLASHAAKLDACHTELTVARCNGCGSVSKFWNRCDLFFCPACAPALARRRTAEVEWWVKTITQPKHVVLTVRNTERLNKDYVQWFKKAFRSLRQSAFARNWEGGFYRIEVTNEGRGWHLHLHALVQARYIDSHELARQWAKRVNQEFAIVKVKDVRQTDYLNEVTKYVVKGDQLAVWNAHDIRAFVLAFEGVRTFGVFGQLYGKRTEWSDYLKELRAGRVRCKCGCNDVRLFSESEWEWEQVKCAEFSVGLPPPVLKPQQRDFAFESEPMRLRFPHD